MTTTTYDELPYESHPYDRTHPDHLASIGSLFGMHPPNVNQCRVLELGCAAGGNLIPQAIAAPECQYVGVDLSKRQLETGWELIKQLELDNIELKHLDICDVGQAEGAFDYIICHGVYSWVPSQVQQRILEICAQQLTENGLAYISYNTRPGWFLRGMVREMMCYHARQFNDAQKQVQQARALLDFLISAGPGSDPTYHALLTRELEILRNRADSYLYHEHLEEENEPLFFYEFNDRCEAAGLRYVGETQFSEMVPGNFSPQAEATLREMSVGLIQAEQYLDFLRNRTFRRSILCRDGVDLDRTINAEKLSGLYVSSQVRPASDTIDLQSGQEEDFVAADGRTLKVSHPLIKAAMVELGENWPNAIPYDDLAGIADQRRSGRPMLRSVDGLATERNDLGATMVELYANDIVEVRGRPPRFTHKLASHPFASPLARLQAVNSRWVTNLRHEMTQLSESQQHLIQILDGCRDRKDMTLAFRELIKQNVLVIEHRGEAQDDQVEDDFLVQLIEHDLGEMLNKALIIR